VALLIDNNNHNQVGGQVGTKVEHIKENNIEVEVADDGGRTDAQLALHRDSLLVIHHRLTRARSGTGAYNELAPPATEVRATQNSFAADTNGLEALYGKWPGDETDEQLTLALKTSK
jgi:hypothetical protein